MHPLSRAPTLQEDAPSDWEEDDEPPAPAAASEDPVTPADVDASDAIQLVEDLTVCLATSYKKSLAFQIISNAVPIQAGSNASVSDAANFDASLVIQL